MHLGRKDPQGTGREEVRRSLTAGMAEDPDGASPSGERDRCPREPSQAPGASSIRIAVTRPVARSFQGDEDRLSRFLRRAGFEPVPCPLLRIEAPPSPEPLKVAVSRFLETAVRNLHERDPREESSWVVVTSRNSLPAFVDALEAAGASAEDLKRAGVQVAAVGSATARALKSVGLPPDLVPDHYTGDDLLEAIRTRLGGRGPRPLEGVQVLFPRAEVARETLPRSLRRLGAEVELVTAYRIVEDRNAALKLARQVDRGGVDIITLTSGSAGRCLAHGWRRLAYGGRGWPESVHIAVIGPITGAAVRDEGLPVHVTPSRSTLKDLVAALVAHVR